MTYLITYTIPPLLYPSEICLKFSFYQKPTCLVQSWLAAACVDGLILIDHIFALFYLGFCQTMGD